MGVLSVFMVYIHGAMMTATKDFKPYSDDARRGMAAMLFEYL